MDTVTDIEAFYHFLGEQIQVGSFDLSPEESVRVFREHQRDLDRLRCDLQPALRRVAEGIQAPTFDLEDVKRRGRERLAAEGIVE